MASVIFGLLVLLGAIFAVLFVVLIIVALRLTWQLGRLENSSKHAIMVVEQRTKMVRQSVQFVVLAKGLLSTAKAQGKKLAQKKGERHGKR